jgi:hypothetical protein
MCLAHYLPVPSLPSATRAALASTIAKAHLEPVLVGSRTFYSTTDCVTNKRFGTRRGCYWAGLKARTVPGGPVD